MECRIDLQSNPICLIIISADGKEHSTLDKIGDGGIVSLSILTDRDYWKRRCEAAEKMIVTLEYYLPEIPNGETLNAYLEWDKFRTAPPEGE